MYIPNTSANVFFPHAAIAATNSKVIKEYNAKPRISAHLIASGLISAAISIWLLSVTLSVHAQEYCPSGAVVTAQSQCPGAVGPVDNLTKSILRLNNSGVNNANDTARVSSALDKIFQKCYETYLITQPKLAQNIYAGFPPSFRADLENDAIQNMTAPIPFKHITNNSATDQMINKVHVDLVKPIADCMKQAQQQPSQQQPSQQQQPYSFPSYQQLPNNNYPLPRILSHSAYIDSIGTVHIVGEVVNQSPVTAKFVKIIVTFYNAYNQVIGTDHTYTQPSNLAPGQRAPFDILVLSGGIPMNQVRNYALTVDAS